MNFEAKPVRKVYESASGNDQTSRDKHHQQILKQQ